MPTKLHGTKFVPGDKCYHKNAIDDLVNQKDLTAFYQGTRLRTIILVGVNDNGQEFVQVAGNPNIHKAEDYLFTDTIISEVIKRLSDKIVAISLFKLPLE